MKKLFSVIMILALLALICMPCFAQNDRLVVDNADILSDYEEQLLYSTLKEISDTLNIDVVALTVNGMDGKSEMDYADDYYDYNGYGRGSDNSGCLLLIDMDERVFWLTTTGGTINALTDYCIDYIIDDITPYLSSGNFYGGYNRYAQLVQEFVSYYQENGVAYDVNNRYGDDAYNNSDDYSSDYYSDYGNSDSTSGGFNGLVGCGIFGLIVAAIVTFAVMRSYKPVKLNPNAAYYLDQGSLVMRGSYDHYLYNHVTAVRIQQESSGSSGGGGSSTHMSSSGTSHGGGGGHF